jgi:IS5 family transposase
VPKLPQYHESKVRVRWEPLETIVALIRAMTLQWMGDAALVAERKEITEDEQLSSIDYCLNRRVGSIQKVPAGTIHREKEIERRQSSVRAKVEHPFLIVKRFFRYSKTVFKGLAKNTHRLQILFASANVLMCARAGRPLPA